MSNSKISVRVLNGLSCTEIYHPGETCSQMLWSVTKTGFPICAAALIPLMLIPPILRKRSKLTKNEAKQMICKWLSVSTCLHLTSIFAQLFMCILTKALGRVYVWTFLFLPVSIGALVTFVMPYGELAATELANNLSVLCIEATLRYFDSIFSYKISRTLVFMCVSTVLMDATRMKKMHNSWWILQPASTIHAPVTGTPSIPSPVIDNFVKAEYHSCSHKGSCDRFIFDGIKTYFAIYLAMDAGRILITHCGTIKNSPYSILRVVRKHFNGKLMTFIMGYATMYRFLSCLLNRQNQKESRATIAISSFLSGSAFYFYPNYTLLAQGAFTTLRVLLLNLSECYPFLNVIKEKLPLSKLINIFASGIMFHLRAFYPYYCPSAAIKATDFVSSHRTGRALKNFTRLYLGYS